MFNGIFCKLISATIKSKRRQLRRILQNIFLKVDKYINWEFYSKENFPEFVNCD